MINETRLLILSDLHKKIGDLERRIADNKDKINDPASPDWLRKILIDDNHKYLNELKDLNQELDKWRK